MIHGPSKAKKLRAFWEIESDYLVGRLLKALVEYAEETAHETTEKYQSGGSATSLPTSTATGADSSSKKSHIVICCD